MDPNWSQFNPIGPYRSLWIPTDPSWSLLIPIIGCPLAAFVYCPMVKQLTSNRSQTHSMPLNRQPISRKSRIIQLFNKTSFSFSPRRQLYVFPAHIPYVQHGEQAHKHFPRKHFPDLNQAARTSSVVVAVSRSMCRTTAKLWWTKREH